MVSCPRELQFHSEVNFDEGCLQFNRESCQNLNCSCSPVVWMSRHRVHETQQVFFCLCKQPSHWLISSRHGPPLVTQPVSTPVVSSILLERSSLGTSPCYSHKITQKLGQKSRERKCGKNKNNWEWSCERGKKVKSRERDEFIRSRAERAAWHKFVSSEQTDGLFESWT